MIIVLLLTLLVAGAVVASVQLSHRRTALGSGDEPAGAPAHPRAVQATPGHPARPAPHRTRLGGLAADLDRWVRDGLIERAQADAIVAHERRVAAAGPRAAVPVSTPAVTPHARIPLVAEALGYIGGVLGLVGVILLVQRSWADLGTPVRLAMTAGATGLAVLGGALVHEHRDPAAARLRGAVWAVATATAGVFGQVFAADVIEVGSDELQAAVAAGAVLVTATLLWWNRIRPLQQVAALGAALVLAGTLAGEFAGNDWWGPAIWITGAVTLVAGIALLTSLPALTVAIGAGGVTIGSIAVAATDQGIGLPVACLTAAALLSLALADRPVVRENQRIVLSVFGIVGAVQSVPQTIAWFARDAGIATGAVVWLIGLALVVLGIERRIRAAVALEVIGGLAMLVGAAVTGVQNVAIATIAGTLTAVGSIALGARPGRVLMSVTGSAGMLVFVPWTIAHFFPGEGRVPLLILVAGAVLVAVAVGMTRQAGRFRRELGAGGGTTGSERGGVGLDAEEQAPEGLVEPR